VAAEQLDEAEQLARTITDPDGRAEALTEVATALVAAEQLDRAEQLARVAEQLQGGITIVGEGKALTQVARGCPGSRRS
jgi:hypothetical protein